MTTTAALFPNLDPHLLTLHLISPPTSALPSPVTKQPALLPWMLQRDRPSFSPSPGSGVDAEKPQMDPPFDSPIIVSHASSTPTPKSSTDLVNEIATLELQILQLESYLLALYRTAFQHDVPILNRDHETHVKDKNISNLRVTASSPYYEMSCAMSPSDFSNQGRFFHSRSLPCSNDQTKAASNTASGRAADDEAQVESGHRSLADHFGTWQMDYAPNCPAKLSEAIVRCMCCIYCKFATPAVPHKGLSTSSTSSMSSSSTFSPRNISGNWSPQYSEETKGCFEGLRDDSGPYGATIEVLNICLDDDSFKYAATMLQKFRSLVKSLENVDPTKMRREEKLAFWLNIHNALVMHGYLAYGTHNFVRSSSILKAAYNVGGQCINAHVIQSAILGIRSRYSAPWLQTILSPKKKKKYMVGTAKHIYSLDYPEPLVHFALCSGSCSDPLVRVYSANNVFQDLKVAREEYIRGSAYYVHKEAKVYLPKVVCYFAREMSLSANQLLEIVCTCLPEVQQKAMRTCIIKRREDKCICWIPQSSTFRFLIRKEDGPDYPSLLGLR